MVSDQEIGQIAYDHEGYGNYGVEAMDLPFIMGSSGLGPDQSNDQVYAYFSIQWDSWYVTAMNLGNGDGNDVELDGYFLTCIAGTSVYDCIHDDSVNKVRDDLPLRFFVSGNLAEAECGGDDYGDDYGGDHSECSSGTPSIKYRDDDNYYVNVTVGEYLDIQGMEIEDLEACEIVTEAYVQMADYQWVEIDEYDYGDTFSWIAGVNGIGSSSDGSPYLTAYISMDY